MSNSTCHSRHAWSQTAFFQFSQTQTALQSLVSFSFPVSQHNYRVLLTHAQTPSCYLLRLRSCRLRTSSLTCSWRTCWRTSCLSVSWTIPILSNFSPFSRSSARPARRRIICGWTFSFSPFFSLMVIENNSDTTDFKDGNNRGVKSFWEPDSITCILCVGACCFRWF